VARESSVVCPKFGSIVMPSHDYGHYVVDAIESVLALTQPHCNNQTPRPIPLRYCSPHGLEGWFLSRIYWGKRGCARMVPESQVSGYEYLRSTWHVGLASWHLTRAALRHGPASQNAFQQLMLLTGRIGYWVGLTGRLWCRFGYGTGRAPGHETSPLQEHASPPSALALPAQPDQHIAPSVAAPG